MSPKNFNMKDPSRHIILQAWVGLLLTRQEGWTVLLGLLWDHYLKTRKSNGSYLSIRFLQGWMEPLLVWCKKRSKTTQLEKGCLCWVPSDCNGWVTVGSWTCRGVLAGNHLPLYLQLFFSSAIRLSSGDDFIILHVVDAVAQTLSKRPHVFSIGFSWGFNTFTSDGRNTAPSASFSLSTQICLSHPWLAQMLCIAQLICLETSMLVVCALIFKIWMLLVSCD